MCSIRAKRSATDFILMAPQSRDGRICFTVPESRRSVSRPSHDLLSVGTKSDTKYPMLVAPQRGDRQIAAGVPDLHCPIPISGRHPGSIRTEGNAEHSFFRCFLLLFENR